MFPMSSLSLLLPILLLSFLSLSLSQRPPKGYLIDCGAAARTVIDGRRWLPDGEFISTGTSKNITVPDLSPTFSTVRSFPLQNNLRRKFCYVARVYRGARYLIRTAYYYGGVNGLSFPSPPVFDQIVDGTFWGMVNTTEDYQKGSPSFYEAVFEAKGTTMSVCVAPNTYTPIFLKLLGKTDIAKRMTLPSKSLKCFPPLSGDTHVVDFPVRDESGRVWIFRIYTRKKKGKYPKPVLTKGWREFVCSKQLCIGDRVAFYMEKEEAGSVKYLVRVEKAVKIFGAVLWHEPVHC